MFGIRLYFGQNFGSMITYRRLKSSGNFSTIEIRSDMIFRNKDGQIFIDALMNVCLKSFMTAGLKTLLIANVKRTLMTICRNLLKHF